LHLRDAHVVEEVLGEGFELVGGCDQPLQPRVGVDLEHPGHSADAQAFRQRAHRPHQLLGCHARAMQRGAMGFETGASAGRAGELPPGSTAGMAVGLQIPLARPTLIGTARIRTEMTLGVHLVRASSGGDDQW
jgi:hypothetical protein